MLRTWRRHHSHKKFVMPRSVLTKHSLFDISIQSIVEESIDAVRDIEETEFAAELRDSEAALLKFIMGVRDLEAPEFPKPKDE